MGTGAFVLGSLLSPAGHSLYRGESLLQSLTGGDVEVSESVSPDLYFPPQTARYSALIAGIIYGKRRYGESSIARAS